MRRRIFAGAREMAVSLVSRSAARSTIASLQRRGCLLRAFLPPYRTADSIESSWARVELPPGTVLLGEGPDTLGTLAALTAASYRWPWAVPCVSVSRDQGYLEPLLLLVSELRDRLAIIMSSRPTTEGDAVLAAVRIRRIPDATTLENWVRQRLGNPELSEAIGKQFREGLGGTPAVTTASVSTFSRLFARHGKYTARDWRAIARLCSYCNGCGLTGDGGMLSIRAARHCVNKYLGLSLRAISERVGWEWVLEVALRAAGYVAVRT